MNIHLLELEQVHIPHHGPMNSTVSSTNNNHFSYKQVLNSVSGTRARVSVIEPNKNKKANDFNSNNKSVPSTPIPLSPQQEDVTSLTQDVFSYGFGVRFSYWAALHNIKQYVMNLNGIYYSIMLQNKIMI